MSEPQVEVLADLEVSRSETLASRARLAECVTAPRRIYSDPDEWGYRTLLYLEGAPGPRAEAERLGLQ